MDKIVELKQERAKIVEEQRSMYDQVDAESRAMTAEEKEVYEKLEARFDELTAEIKTMEDDRAKRDVLKAREDMLDKVDTRQFRPDETVGEKIGRASEEYRQAYDSFLRRGKNALDATEIRALQVGTDSEGGYLVPDEFEKTLVEGLTNVNVMRQLCTVIQTSNGTTDIPVVSSQGSADWTLEEAAYKESDDAFTQVTLSAYKLTRIIKVSEELLNDSAFGIEGYIAKSFSNAFGIAEENAFVNGDGSSKPTGITDSAGVGVTAAAPTAITADELIDLYHSLGRAYRQRASFLMADSTAKIIRKLKDGDSQYIWQPGLQAGQPDRILSRPVYISDYCEAATAGLKPIVFADFSYYWIADRVGRSFQRLNELYAANGQVGFKASQRLDGKLTLAAAAKVLQMSA